MKKKQDVSKFYVNVSSEEYKLIKDDNLDEFNVDDTFKEMFNVKTSSYEYNNMIVFPSENLVFEITTEGENIELKKIESGNTSIARLEYDIEVALIVDKSKQIMHEKNNVQKLYLKSISNKDDEDTEYTKYETIEDDIQNFSLENLDDNKKKILNILRTYEYKGPVEAIYYKFKDSSNKNVEYMKKQGLNNEFIIATDEYKEKTTPQILKDNPIANAMLQKANAMLQPSSSNNANNNSFSESDDDGNGNGGQSSKTPTSSGNGGQNNINNNTGGGNGPSVDQSDKTPGGGNGNGNGVLNANAKEFTPSADKNNKNDNTSGPPGGGNGNGDQNNINNTTGNNDDADNNDDGKKNSDDKKYEKPATRAKVDLRGDKAS